MDLPQTPRIVVCTPRVAVAEEFARCLPGFAVDRFEPAGDPAAGPPGRGPCALVAIDFDAAWDAASIANRWWESDPTVVVVGFRSDRAAWEAVASRLAAADRLVCLATPFVEWEVRHAVAAALVVRQKDEQLRHMARQVTEARRALDQAREEAENARRTRLEFIANVNHEIRTPMNAVLGFTSLLLREPLEPEHAEKVRIVHEADNLLDFSQLCRGQLQLDHMPFDLDEVLGDVLETAGPWVREKRLGLECHIEPAVPRALRGDAARLRQVLLSLLDNAIKFTERGVVRLQVLVDEQTAGVATLRMTVADTGVGVPSDREDRILDCFTQADGSTTRRFGGMGLGLSLAKHLVDLMGGQLGFRSANGRGSSFWVVLPFPTWPPQDADAPKTAEKPRALRVASASCSRADAAGEPASGPRRVLVADDDRMNRALVELLLTRAGCFVDLVTNGREALDALGVNRYDLLLIDVHMPRVDGLEAIRRIREEEACSGHRLRIVATTADTLRETRDKCLEAGADDYLPIPFTLESLFQMLQRNLAGWTVDGEGPVGDPEPESASPEAVLTECVECLEGALGRYEFDDVERRAETLRQLAAQAGWEAGVDHALRVQLAARNGDLPRAAAAAARLRREFELRRGELVACGDRVFSSAQAEKDP
ncbi:MAG: ATP-binding protein [Thermoguttaceae bacterium]|nr:ATP-binding protein [Thermoguttaceae bacterium]